MGNKLQELYDAKEEESYNLLESITKICHNTNDEYLKKLYKDYLKDIEEDLGLLE